MGLHNQESLQDLSSEAMKGGGVGFLGTGIGKLIVLVLNVMIARSLGSSGYGLYSIGSTIVKIASRMASLGLPSGIVRFGVMYRTSNDSKRVKGLILSSILTSLVVSIPLAIWIDHYSSFLGIGIFGDTQVAPVIGLMVWSIPSFCILQASASVAQIFRRIDINQLLNAVLQPAIMVLLVLVLLPIAGHPTAIAGIYSLAAGISAIVGLYVVYRLSPEVIASMRAVFEIKALLRFSIPVLFSGLLYILLSSLDRLMLGILAGTADVGMFSAASNLSQVMTLVLAAFTPISMTMIAELYENNRMSELSEIYQSISRWILLVTMPAFLVVLMAPDELMLIFGRSFASGGTVLLVLSAGQLFNAGTGPVGKLMEMTGKQDINVAVIVFVIILNASLNFLLIPVWGALGAAVSTSVSTLLVFGGLVQLAGRMLGLRLLGSRMLYILIIGGTSAMFAWIVRFALYRTSLGVFVNPSAALAAVLFYLLVVLLVGLSDFDKVVFRLMWASLRKNRRG